MSNKFWKTSFPLASIILAGGLTIASCTTGTTDTATAQGRTSIVRQVADTASTSEGTTGQTSSDTAKAAEEFLSTLSDEQKEQVLYDYNDETKSTSWSNFPVTFVERSGIKLGDPGETQRAAALKVLKALLNDEAYAKVTGIMAGDQYLKDNANASDLGNTQYNIAFFGSPSTTNDWSIQFGGHHVGINATFSNGAITFAPTHLGTQPTTYTDSNGQTQSALGDMYQTAFDFYNSLTDEQKQKLYQGEEVKNLTCAPGDTCDYPTGTGIKVFRCCGADTATGLSHRHRDQGLRTDRRAKTIAAQGDCELDKPGGLGNDAGNHGSDLGDPGRYLCELVGCNRV